MTGNSAANLSATKWVPDFCGAYSSTILTIAQIFLWAGLAFALLAAAAEAIALFRRERQVEAGMRDNAPALPAIVEALMGLIQALGGAKVWLVMIIMGVLLLWMAGNAVPDICKPSPAAGNQQPGGGTRTGSAGQPNAGG